jgi:hypothetical protein
MRKFSQGMIEKSMVKGDGNDIMSVLLRANASEDPKTRLTDKEVADQIKYATCVHHRTTRTRETHGCPQRPSLRRT